METGKNYVTSFHNSTTFIGISFYITVLTPIGYVLCCDINPFAGSYGLTVKSCIWYNEDNH